MGVSQKTKLNYHMIQQSLFWVFTQKNLKTFIRKDICIPMFIAALFMVARTWKQLKCHMIDEWINKMWYIYTVEYFPDIK